MIAGSVSIVEIRFVSVLPAILYIKIQYFKILKYDLTIYNIPCTIFIRNCSCIIPVYYSIIYIEPAILIIC